MTTECDTLAEISQAHLINTQNQELTHEQKLTQEIVRFVTKRGSSLSEKTHDGRNIRISATNNCLTIAVEPVNDERSSGYTTVGTYEGVLISCSQTILDLNGTKDTLDFSDDVLESSLLQTAYKNNLHYAKEILFRDGAQPNGKPPTINRTKLAGRARSQTGISW